LIGFRCEVQSGIECLLHFLRKAIGSHNLGDGVEILDQNIQVGARINPEV
jgi:hypothetical protein